MKLKKAIIILVLLLFPSVYAVEQYMDRTTTSVVANGFDSAYSFGIWTWENGFYTGYFGSDGLGADRILIDFDISAVESANVKVKSVLMGLTYSTHSGTPLYDAKQLTTVYYTTDNAATVMAAVGAAANYVTSKGSGSYYDLGANANTQLENFLDDGAFSVGIMETGENGDVGQVTSYGLLYTYYYPPNETSIWLIDEDYPVGKSSGLGVGEAALNGGIRISNIGNLTLNGNTDLNCASPPCNMNISGGGRLVMETSSRLRI